MLTKILNISQHKLIITTSNADTLHADPNSK